MAHLSFRPLSLADARAALVLMRRAEGGLGRLPDEMDLCLTCRKAHCSGAEYRNCEPRKARAAELVAARQVVSIASASRTTAASAPGSKGETSPADLTSA